MHPPFDKPGTAICYSDPTRMIGQVGQEDGAPVPEETPITRRSTPVEHIVGKRQFLEPPQLSNQT